MHCESQEQTCILPLGDRRELEEGREGGREGKGREGRRREREEGEVTQVIILDLFFYIQNNAASDV